MRFIKDLDKATIKRLEKMERNEKSYQVRQRAKAILLSNEGRKVSELCKILKKSSRTIYRWFDRFKELEFHNLSNASGQGRKPSLSVEKDSKVSSFTTLYHFKSNILKHIW